MCGGSPSAPTPPPAVPEAPRAPEVSGRGGEDADVRRRRAATGAGRSTILTGARGVQDGAATAQKTLLGE
jgi:hypothetical protein